MKQIRYNKMQRKKKRKIKRERKLLVASWTRNISELYVLLLHCSRDTLMIVL